MQTKPNSSSVVLCAAAGVGGLPAETEEGRFWCFQLQSAEQKPPPRPPDVLPLLEENLLTSVLHLLLFLLFLLLLQWPQFICFLWRLQDWSPKTSRLWGTHWRPQPLNPASLIKHHRPQQRQTRGFSTSGPHASFEPKDTDGVRILFVNIIKSVINSWDVLCKIKGWFQSFQSSIFIVLAPISPHSVVFATNDSTNTGNGNSAETGSRKPGWTSAPRTDWFFRAVTSSTHDITELWCHLGPRLSSFKEPQRVTGGARDQSESRTECQKIMRWKIDPEEASRTFFLWSDGIQSSPVESCLKFPAARIHPSTRTGPAVCVCVFIRRWIVSSVWQRGWAMTGTLNDGLN